MPTDPGLMKLHSKTIEKMIGAKYSKPIKRNATKLAKAGRKYRKGLYHVLRKGGMKVSGGPAHFKVH